MVLIALVGYSNNVHNIANTPKNGSQKMLYTCVAAADAMF